MRNRAHDVWWGEDNAILVYLVLVVLLFRSFFYYFNSSIFFNPVGWIDSFWYMGVGLYYGIPDFSANYYKISRVPWNILEFLARQALPPGSAAYVLQSSIAVLTSVAIFLYFRHLIGRSQSFLLASFSIFIPLLHASGGADYHNALTGSLYFLSLALLVDAILRSNNSSAFFAGATLTATLHTNPLFVLLAPMIAFNVFALCLESNRSSLFVLYAVFFALAGSLSATMLLGFVHVLLGREFLFFLPQIKFLFVSLNTHSPTWLPPSWQWIRNSKENAYMLSVCLFCSVEILIIVVQKRVWQNREATAAYAGFIITYSVAVAYQLKGQTTLQPSYFTYPFLAATITPIAYIVNRYFGAAPHPVLIYIGFPLLCALSLIFNQDIQRALPALPPFLEVAWVSASVYGLIILLSGSGRNIGVVLLAAFNGVLVNFPEQYAYDPCHSTRHLNILISTMSRMSTELATSPQNVFVWFDRNERTDAQPCFIGLKMADVGSSLAGTLGIGHNYLGKHYEPTQIGEFTRETFAEFKAVKGLIVLVVANDRVKTQFTEAAASVRIDLHLGGLYQDRASGVKFFFFRSGLP